MATISGNRAILSKILKNAQVGAYLPPGHQITVLAMAKQIPQYAKLAEHISAKVIVKKHTRYNVKHFYIHSDSHFIPILMGQLALAGVNLEKLKPPSNRQVVLKTCRDIIAPQIIQWAKEFWDTTAHMKPGPKCPISGRSLRANKAAVDHIYPFVRLVEEWAKERDLDLEQIQTKANRKLGRRTMGPTLDQSWADYHKERATLQMLTAKANLAKGDRQELSQSSGLINDIKP